MEEILKEINVAKQVFFWWAQVFEGNDEKTDIMCLKELQIIDTKISTRKQSQDKMKFSKNEKSFL